MIDRVDCASAERYAGAIALDEADDCCRDAYRKHLAHCERCLTNLGGEREIERAMSVVARAREDEGWQPDLRVAFARRPNTRAIWAAAVGLIAIVLIVAGSEIPRATRTVIAARQAIPAHEAQALAVLGTQTSIHTAGRAESLVLGSAGRPTTFEVSIDSHGNPVRCMVTQSSGDGAFDRSICRNAMHAHYPAESLKSH